jgi:hypothetical protein
MAVTEATLAATSIRTLLLLPGVLVVARFSGLASLLALGCSCAQRLGDVSVSRATAGPKAIPRARISSHGELPVVTQYSSATRPSRLTTATVDAASSRIRGLSLITAPAA